MPRFLHNRLIGLSIVWLILCTSCTSYVVKTPPQQSQNLWHDRELKIVTKSGEMFQVTSFCFLPEAIEGDTVPWESRDSATTPIRQTISFDDIESVELLREPTQYWAVPAAIVVAMVLIPVFQKGLALEVRPKSSGGSCPYLYVACDTGWQRTAELFTGSILPSLQSEDWIPLPSSAFWSTNSEVLITNELPELHYIDRLIWALSEHPQGSRIVRDQSGNLWTIGNADRPFDISETRSVCQILQRLDLKLPDSVSEDLVLEITARNTWQGEDVLADLAALVEPSQVHWATVVEKNPARLNRIKRGLNRISMRVSRWTDDGWDEICRIPVVGPAISRSSAVHLPHSSIGGKPSKIRLEWLEGSWILESVSASPVLGSASIDRYILVPEAITSQSTVMTAQLHHVDGHYAILAPGDTMRVALPDHSGENKFDPNLQTVFLIADGYYTRASDRGRGPVLERIIGSMISNPSSMWDYLSATAIFFAPGH